MCIFDEPGVAVEDEEAVRVRDGGVPSVRTENDYVKAVFVKTGVSAPVSCSRRCFDKARPARCADDCADVVAQRLNDRYLREGDRAAVALAQPDHGLGRSRSVSDPRVAVS